MKRVEGRTMVIHELLLKVVVLGTIILGSRNHTAEADASIAKRGCPSSCGNLSIPYPFGLRDSDPHCHIGPPSFIVHCDNSTNPPVPFWWNKSSNIEILSISVEDHELRVKVPIGQYCSSGQNASWIYPSAELAEFPISSTKNKFTAVGCNTQAILQELSGEFSFGCMSLCGDVQDAIDGSCSGIGCCQMSIPRDIVGYNINIWSFHKHSVVLESNPCSYAFVAENNFYNFSVSDLSKFKFNKSALVLDWAIGNQTCEDARKNTTSYMCTENTICTDAENGFGYNCTCKNGYRGNPYLENGCRDIDECEDSKLNLCERKCNNTEGSFTCLCPKGYHGDGKKGGGDGQGCNPNPSHLMKILVGIAAGIIVLLFSIDFLYLGHKKRKLIMLREQYFKQNGGLLLQQQLHERDRTAKAAKIFSAEELEKATDNYDESRIVGQGGYGTVYKGSLPNDTVVAIKKSKLVKQSQIEQFVNEVIVLSQINNRNVVKLLGCCLETEVPLLVYEFVDNGTLFDHVHNPNKSSKLTWETRLRIATETAGVLSYLHSTASTPIIHRDVKSTNILLDANCTAKVSDFGASRLVPLDQTQLSTLVQGTLGYLDPEYFLTSQLTEESDVYSFGVVLVELLTGKKALCFDRPEEERSLATYFLSSLRNDKLFQIVEEVVANEGNDEQVREVANLAKRCLEIKGEERPTMKEVAMELEGLRAMAKHPWAKGIDVNPEETVYLLGETTDVYMDSIATTSTGYADSMKSHVMPLVSSGR